MGGLEIYYAARPEDLTEIVARQIQELQRARCLATVITSNAVLEQRAQSLGSPILRATTFCKALDLSRNGTPDGRPPRDDGGAGGRREDRGGHRRRRRSGGGSGVHTPRAGRPPEPAEPALSPTPAAAGTAEPPPNNARGAEATGGGTAPSPSDNIRKLIDLVE